MFVTIMVGAVTLAAADGEGRGCSNATLKGHCGFILSGTKPSGPPPAPLEQMIGLSITYFDGTGGATQTDNIHGSMTGLVAPDRPGTGSYSINPDCTGTGLLLNAGTPPLEVRYVIVNNGKEVLVAVMSPANVMVSGTGKKL
jgi:hypothetical protein